MRGQKSSLELGFKAAQTWAFFDEFQILAPFSRVQKNKNSDITEFSRKV